MKLLGRVFLVLVVLAFALAGVSYGSEGQVTIKRDNFGVGHVYADTVYGLYYGYGYAVAQDRLFQMEMAKRSTQGKVAEVLGSRAARTKRLHRSARDQKPALRRSTQNV